MSLRFVDGFDHYTSTSDLINKWGSYGYNSGGSPTITTSTTRFGTGGAFQLTNINTDQYMSPRKTLDSQGTWIVGFGFRFDRYQSNPWGTLCVFADLTGGTQGTLFCNWPNGTLSVARGSTIVATSTNQLPINTWNFIEFKHVINGTTGTLEARVNGVVWVTFTGNTQNLGFSTANTLILSGSNSGGPACTVVEQYDDLYLCDGQGTVNNNYLGDCRVSTLLPNAAGTDASFTQTGGTGGQPWTAVNNSAPDGDTSYLGDSVVGDSQTLAFQDLTGSPGVRGVSLTVDARKDDAGPRTVSAIARPGVTDQLGTAWSPGTSYIMTQTIWENNPDTSNPWQASEVNAAEFGIKNVS